MIAVQGPNARAKVLALLHQASARDAVLGKAVLRRAERRATWFVARTGYTGEDGFEIIGAGSEGGRVLGLRCSPPASQPCGLGARDTLRLEAGMNLYGQDMDETRDAARSGPGLDGRARRRPRLHRPRRARSAEGRRRAAPADRPGARREGRAAPRPEVLTDSGEGEIPAARSRRRWARDRAGARARPRAGD